MTLSCPEVKDDLGLVKKFLHVISTLTGDRHFILLGLFVTALAIKVTIFFFATDPIIFSKYPYFAQRIAQGLDIGERLVDLSPVYLYINVIFYQIFGSKWEMLAILQILIGSLNCLIIYLIGEKLFGKLIGIIAAVILALYGNLTLIELTLEPETFVIFFSSLALLSLLRAKDDPARTYPQEGIENLPVSEMAEQQAIAGRMKNGEQSSSKNLPRGDTGSTIRQTHLLQRLPLRWFIAGMLLGLSAITKPNTLLLLPGALIWIWWDRIKISKRMIATLCLLLGATLLVSPVTLRNYLKFHDVILITADGGKVFFHGNGPGATGMDRADLPYQGFLEEGQSEPDYAHALFRSTARALSGTPLKPSGCSNYWFHYTLNYIKAHPSEALFLEIKKSFFFWSNYEVHDIDSTYKNYLTMQSWPLIPFGAIAALGILGMMISIRRFGEILLLYWMILIYFFSVLIFFAASRYRLPVVPFLSIFAASALHYLLLQIRDKKWKRCGVCLGIALVVAAGTYLPFRDEIEKFDRWQQATRIHYSLGGSMLFKKGEYREAIREFQKTLAIDPNFAPALNYLGKSYAILNDYGQAEEAFQRVIQLAPKVDEGYMNLGLLYELRKNNPRAIEYINKALVINPKNEKARSHLKALTAPQGMQ